MSGPTLRRSLATVAAFTVGLLVGCSDDPNVRAVGPTDDAPVEAVPDRLVDLPPSPIGEWPIYNWVWLVDGSGFVQAGAVKVDGDGNVTPTPAAARFSVAGGRYERLPDLPVRTGMGVAAGAQVGDHLVVVGQDCPPMPGTSHDGVDFCADGAMGTKVVLVLNDGASTWRRVDLPEWMAEFRYGTPHVLGVVADEVLLASGLRPAHLGALDPAAGTWRQLADAPHPDAELCTFASTTIAWTVSRPWDPPIVDAGSPAGRWWTLDGTSWAEVTPPVDGAIGTVACTTGGVAIEVPSMDRRTADIWWYDGVAAHQVADDQPVLLEGPTAGPVARISPLWVVYGDATTTSLPTTTGPGDTSPAETAATADSAAPSTIPGAPPDTLRFVGTDGVIDTGVRVDTWVQAVGDVVVVPNDTTEWGRGDRESPQVLALPNAR